MPNVYPWNFYCPFLLPFSLRLLHCSHVMSMLFLVFFCEPIPTKPSVSYSSVIKLSRIHCHKAGPILHNSSAILYFFRRIFFFVWLIYLGFGKPIMTLPSDFIAIFSAPCQKDFHVIWIALIDFDTFNIVRCIFGVFLAIIDIFKIVV